MQSFCWFCSPATHLRACTCARKSILNLLWCENDVNSVHSLIKQTFVDLYGVAKFYFCISEGKCSYSCDVQYSMHFFTRKSKTDNLNKKLSPLGDKELCYCRKLTDDSSNICMQLVGFSRADMSGIKVRSLSVL